MILCIILELQKKTLTRNISAVLCQEKQYRKKRVVKTAFEEGLVFIGVQSAESVLLNIFLLRMLGAH